MAKSEIYFKLELALETAAYPILIGRHLLQDNSLINHHVQSKQVCIVTNTTVAPLYLPVLRKALANKQCDVVILDDGEFYKTSSSLFQIYDTLVHHQHHRDTTLIALGGGVIGDITGFAASTYQRGVSFIQIPTTLLAQVDSAVGGKTAINHPQGKNLIGTFYQPDAVIMDMGSLATLPSREFRAGLAEIIKYAILQGGAFLEALLLALQNRMDCHSPSLPAIIRDCCLIKAGVVQSDERELNNRALLNLGHTIGHALEACTHYQRWLHGEAVAIGLYCAALLSHYEEGLSIAVVNTIDELLRLAELPRRIPRDINLLQLRECMNQDKKIKNNTLRFVLIRALGDCYLKDGVAEPNLERALGEAFEGE